MHLSRPGVSLSPINICSAKEANVGVPLRKDTLGEGSVVGEDRRTPLLILKCLMMAQSHRHQIILCNPKGGRQRMTAVPLLEECVFRQPGEGIGGSFQPLCLCSCCSHHQECHPCFSLLVQILLPQNVPSHHFLTRWRGWARGIGLCSSHPSSDIDRASPGSG